MKLQLFCTLIFSSIISQAQVIDTLYLDNKNDLANKNSFSYYLTIKKDSNNSNFYLINEFYKSGNIKRVCKYYSKKESITKENFIQLRNSKKIYPLNEDVSYYESGQKKNEYYFESKDKKSMDRLFMQNGDTLYLYADKMPEYPGGYEELNRYLLNNVTYPEQAKKDNTTGTVAVSFVVDKHGDIQDIEVVKSVHPILDEEAIRVIKSIPKKWIPGIHKGIPRNIVMVMPFRF